MQQATTTKAVLAVLLCHLTLSSLVYGSDFTRHLSVSGLAPRSLCDLVSNELYVALMRVGDSVRCIAFTTKAGVD
jgi:hypothetical protein